MFAEAVEIRDRLAVLVDRLDPDAVSGSAARELWGVLDKSERLCAAGKTLLARRIGQTHQRSSGSRSAAEELARRGGTSTGQAKDSLNTSDRLPDQPELNQALRRGELSPAQAALISEAAAADPSQAGRLTELASRVSLAELREECARVRAAADPDPEATNRRIHAQRRLRHYRDAEGGWNLSARGTAQAGAAFLTVLNAITDAIFQQARRDGRKDPVEAYAFDALMAMAQLAAGDQPADPAPAKGAGAPDADTPDGIDQPAAAVDRADQPVDEQPATRADAGHPPGGSGDDVDTAANGDDSTSLSGQVPGSPDAVAGAGTPFGGDPGIFGFNPGPAMCPVPPNRWSNPRYLALLRVDIEALRRGQVAGREMCEIAGVGPVPVSVARQVLGEAIVKLVITRGVDVVNVTHLGRGPTAAQRAALLWINPTCSVEGCNRRRVEWDHRQDWAKTRHTRLDELDALCEFHHDLKTRLGWALVPGTGKRAFVPPDDPRHPNHQPARRDQSIDQPTGAGGRSEGGQSPGRGQPPTERDRPSAGDRPTGRPAHKRDTGTPKDAASGRRQRARPRSPAAAQQPDLFAAPQPP